MDEVVVDGYDTVIADELRKATSLVNCVIYF
jgi:hypothetical protein